MLNFEQSSEADDRHPTWLAVAEDVTWKIQCEKGFGGDGNCQILKKHSGDSTFYAVDPATNPELAMKKVRELHEEHFLHNPMRRRVLGKVQRNGLPNLTIQRVEQTHKAINAGQSNFSSPDEKLVASELHRELEGRR